MYSDKFDLGLFLTLYVPYIIFAIVAYVLCSISFFKVAKRRGIRLYGLAWVPVAAAWLLGSIADAHDRQRGVEHKWRSVLLWLSIIMAVGFLAMLLAMYWIANNNTTTTMSGAVDTAMMWLAIVSALAIGVCSMAYLACGVICIYKFYESCRPRSTVTFLLLSFILPITFPFFVFACRDWDNDIRKTGDEPEPPYIPQQSQTTAEYPSDNP